MQGESQQSHIHGYPLCDLLKAICVESSVVQGSEDWGLILKDVLGWMGKNEDPFFSCHAGSKTGANSPDTKAWVPSKPKLGTGSDRYPVAASRCQSVAGSSATSDSYRCLDSSSTWNSDHSIQRKATKYSQDMHRPSTQSWRFDQSRYGYGGQAKNPCVKSE